MERGGVRNGDKPKDPRVGARRGMGGDIPRDPWGGGRKGGYT